MKPLTVHSAKKKVVPCCSESTGGHLKNLQRPLTI